MWHARWKKVLSRILIVSLSLPAAMLAGFGTASVAHASVGGVVINEVLPNPGSGDEMVELYNAGETGQDISGWTITNAANATIHTVPENTPLLVSGAFYSADLGATPVLTDTGDTVTLMNGVSSDSVAYGNNLAADITAPATSKTIGQVADGTDNWYSGLTSSIGATNGLPSRPAFPTTARVKAGSESATNAIDVINNSSKEAVSIDVTVSDGSLSTDQLTAQLNDGVTLMQATTAAITGAGTVTVTPINATSNNEGAVTVRTYAVNAVGVGTAYVNGTAATKDTVAPNIPTVTSPTTTKTVHASTFTITGTNDAGSIVKVYAADGTTLIGTATVTGTTYSYSAPLTSNSPNNFTVRALDSFNNASGTVVVPTITEDSTAPTAIASVSTTAGTDGKVTLSWPNSVSTDVANYTVLTDNGTGSTPSVVIATVTPGSSSTSYVTDVLVNTTYKFAIHATDTLGNIGTDTASLPTAVNGPKTQTSAATPGTEVSLPTSNLSFTPSATGSGASTFTVTNLGTTVPLGSLPSGLSFLGQFFEVTDSNTTSFPVLVKYYYTQAQLDAANMTESQLIGIYYYDSASNSWNLYSSTGVNTADVTVNGVQYTGYLYAYADHFTPIAFGGDNTAPVKPGTFTATAGNAKVDLAWEQVSDVTSYWVRYREATTKDTISYTMVYVSGSSNVKATIQSLKNGVLYEFGVAAVDSVGNIGIYAVVNARPISTVATATLASVTGTSGTSTIVAGVADTTSTQSTETSESTPSSSTDESKEKPSTTTDEGQVKSASTDGSSDAGRNRIYVTLLILLIAAGAGAAGYYGYQWWSDRPTPTPTPAEPTAPPAAKPDGNGKGKGKSSSKGGRW